jgi:hypothetical protein
MGSVLAGLSSGLNGVGNTVGDPIGSTPGGQNLLAQINGGGGASMAPVYANTTPGNNTAILNTIKTLESGGDYTAINKTPGATASGAYQYTDSTWRQQASAAGVDINQYPRAYLAPPAVQDMVASKNVDTILQQNGGDVTKVPNVWYTGNPNGDLSAKDQAYNNGLSSSTYQQKFMNQYDIESKKLGASANYDPRSDLPSENAFPAGGTVENSATTKDGFKIPGGDNIANDPTKPYNPSSNNEGFDAVKTPLSPEGQAAIDAQQKIIDQARTDLKSLPDVAANANVSLTTYTAIMGQLYDKIDDAQNTINVLKANNGVIPEAGTVRPLSITPIGPIIVPIIDLPNPPEPSVTPDNNAIIRVDAGDTLAGLQFAGLYPKNTASDAGWQYGSKSNNTAPIYTAGGDPGLSAYSSNFLESVANGTAPKWTTVNGSSYRTDSIISPSDAAAEVSRRLSSGSFSITSPGGDPALSAYSDAALRSVVNGNAPSATQTFFGDRGSPVATPTTKVIDPLTAQRELDARGVPSEPVSTDIVTTPDTNFTRTDNASSPWNLTGYQRDVTANVAADQPSLFQRLYGGSPAPTITDQPFNPDNPNFVQSDRGTATNPNNDGSTAPAPATTPNNPPNIQDAIDASIAADNPGTPAPPDTSSNSGPAQPVTGTGGTGGGPTSPPGNSVPMSLSGPAC